MIKPTFFLKLLQIINLLFLLVLPGQLFATHIVGGDINYRCLGSNEYEILLHVYRDCDNGDPLAPFDNPASIGIFDQDGILVKELLLPLNDTAAIGNEFDKCITQSTSLCIEGTEYRGIVELEPRAGGYQIVYQRCCRNFTINNIVNPLETGASYDIFLTEEAMAICNNSPTLGAWPPVGICVNQPLSFDHSATDLDGDVLVYKLCGPLAGANQEIPKPQPPNNPPYDSVVYVSPTYSIGNMLGATEEANQLSIDPNTGLITATPGITGQFVVGICVEEYDRETGVLLSETRRDFQLNVFPCGPTVAAMQAPETQCGDLNVNFENQSEGAADYIWFFDWPAQTLTSTEKDPSFTYAETGTYEVALIANPNAECADTTFRTITLLDETVDVDFKIEVFNCPDSAIVGIDNVTEDSLGTITDWQWDLVLENGEQLSFNGPAPIFKLPLQTTGTLTLTASFENGCVETVTKPLDTGDRLPTDYVIDSLFEGCVGQTIRLTPFLKVCHTWGYRWQPVEGLDDPTAGHPRFKITGATKFILELIAPDSSCSYFQEITVEAPPAIGLNIIGGGKICTEYTVLRAETVEEATIQWFTFDGDLLGEGDTLLFKPEGTQGIRVEATDSFMCVQKGSVTVIESVIDLEYPDSITFCAGDTVEVGTVNLNPDQELWFLWASPTLSIDDSLASSVMISGPPGTHELALCSDNNFKCKLYDTLTVTILDENFDLDFNTEVQCDGKTVIFNNNSDPNLKYRWNFGDPDNPEAGSTDFSPTYTYNTPGVYTVTLTIEGENIEACTDTLQKEVEIVEPSVVADFNFQIEECLEDSIRINFMDQSSTNIGQIVSWDWEFGTTDNSTLQNPLLVIEPFDSIEVTLNITTSSGCNASVTKTVAIEFPEIEIEGPDTLDLCLGDSLQLNVIGDDNLSYTWSPAEGLSQINIRNPKAAPQITTTYTVVGNSPDGGCPATDSITIRVSTESIIDLELVGDSLICLPGLANLEAISNATDIKWYADAALSDQLAEGNTANLDVQISGTIFYVEAQDNSACPSVIDSIEVNIFSEEIGLQDSLIKSCSSGGVALNSEGNSNYTYVWSPETDLDLTEPWNPIFIGSTSRDYMVTVTDGNNLCEEVRTITVEVLPEVTVMTQADTSVCGADSLILTATGSVEPLIWYSDRELSNEVGRGGRVKVDLQEATKFYVQAVNELNCTALDSVMVDTNITVACLPDEVTVCANESEELGPDCDATLTYTWSSEENLDLTNPNNPIFTGTASTTYFVTITDGECTAVDTVEVIVIEGVELEAQEDMTICEAGTVTLSASSNAESVVWYSDAALTQEVGQGLAVEVEVEEMTTFYVQAITGDCEQLDSVEVRLFEIVKNCLPDELPVCANESEELGPDCDATLTYTWSSEENLDLTNPNNPIFTGAESTTYFVTITDGECTAVDTIEVIVIEGVELEAQEDTTICEAGTVTLSASSNAENVVWYSDAALTQEVGQGLTVEVEVEEEEMTTLFYVQASTGDCEHLDSVEVRLFEIVKNCLPDELPVCANESEELGPDCDATLTYTWSSEENLDLTNPNNPIFTGTASTTYFVTITDGECTALDTVEVIVIEGVELEAQEDMTICEAGTVTLSASSNAENVVWYSDADLTQEVGQGLTVEVEVEEMTTLFYVQASTGDCEQLDSVEVRLFEIVKNCLPDELPVCANESEELGPDCDATLTYTWSSEENLDLTNPNNPIFTGAESTTYFVTITDGECTAVDTVEVIVREEVDLTTPNDTLICTPGDLTLSVITSAPKVRWFDDAQLSNEIATGLDATIPIESSTFVYVEAQDGNGCTRVDSILVRIFEDELDCIQDTVPVCPGVATPISPDCEPEFIYNWEPTDGLALGVPSNPSVNIEESTTYSVTVTSADGLCSIEKDVFVEVQDLPGLTVSNDISVCTTDSLVLSADAPNASSIRWFGDAQLFELISVGPTLDVEPAERNKTYFVVATTPNRCTEIDSVNVEAFIINFDAPADTICSGITLNPLITLDPDYDYVWEEVEGLDLSDPNNPTATLEETTTFNLSISNDSTGCSVDTFFTVVVREHPGIDISNDTTLCFAERITLSASSDSDGSFIWFDQPDMTTLISRGPSISINANFAERTYYAEFTDVNGCTNIDSVKVSVFDEQSRLVNDNFNVCSNTPTTIFPTDSRFGFNYRWTPDPVLEEEDTANPTVTVDSTASLEVTITNNLGCEVTRRVTVVAYPQLEMKISKDTVICSDSTLTLSASASNEATIVWYRGDTLGSPIGTGNMVTVTVPVNMETNYIAVATDVFMCELDTQVTVLYNPLIIDLVDSESICEGEAIALNPNGGVEGQLYTWSPEPMLLDPTEANPIVSPDSSQLFEVVVTNSEQTCEVRDSIFIEVFPKVEAIIPNDTTTCDDTPIDLTIEGDLEDVTIRWADDKTFANIISTEATANVIPMEGRRAYYVEVRNSITGCSLVDSVEVNIEGINAVIAEGDTVIVCKPGDMQSLTVQNLNPDDDLIFEWFPTELIDSDPLIGEVTVTPDSTTTYNVEVTNQNNCATILTTTVVVVDLMSNVTISAEQDTLEACGAAPSTVISVDGCENCEYTWSPSGSLSSNNISNPVATPSETTTYTVKIRQGDCDLELSQTIVVNPCQPCEEPFVFIPDAFTPNGDGLNDVFLVRGENIGEFLMIVFNRFGQEIFRSTNPNIGWDGTFNGQPLPTGGFAYRVELTCIGDSETIFVKQGSVTLFR